MILQQAFVLFFIKKMITYQFVDDLQLYFKKKLLFCIEKKS